MQHGEVCHGVKKRVRVCWGERRGNKVVQLKARGEVQSEHDCFYF